MSLPSMGSSSTAVATSGRPAIQACMAGHTSVLACACDPGFSFELIGLVCPNQIPVYGWQSVPKRLRSCAVSETLKTTLDLAQQSWIRSVVHSQCYPQPAVRCSAHEAVRYGAHLRNVAPPACRPCCDPWWPGGPRQPCRTAGRRAPTPGSAASPAAAAGTSAACAVQQHVGGSGAGAWYVLALRTGTMDKRCGVARRELFAPGAGQSIDTKR